MQKRIILAVIMLITVTTFSCQKDQNLTNNNLASGKLKSNCTFLLNVTTNEWCTYPGNNCCGTTEIVAKKITNIIDMANDPLAIADYFSATNYTEWSIIFPYVTEDSQLRELLQSGKITFEILQDPNTSGRWVVRMHNADNTFSIGFPFLVI